LTQQYHIIMATATAQLERQLTITAPNYTGHHNPHAIAHASLEALQEAGDPQFLFLRVILGKQSMQHAV
jgi:hypothetical protein